MRFFCNDKCWSCEPEFFENQATNNFITKLKQHGHFWKATDRYRAGIPDIVGCFAGRFIGIEMKIDYNQPTQIQLYTLNDIIKNLGYGAIVRYSNKRKAWFLGSDGTEYTMMGIMTRLLDRMKHHAQDL